jgi:hypothetical protein
MLAALDRPETSVCNGKLSQLSLQIPTPFFRAACRELCVRIWIELELLAQAVVQTQRHYPPRDIVMSAAILRLELVVLVDSCRTAHWRSMLSVEHCDSLCSMVTDVLAALYVESGHLSDAITEAQDRVLDELLRESAARSPLADLPSVCELGQGSDPAIDELFRLIEGQAACPRRSPSSMRAARVGN